MFYSREDFAKICFETLLQYSLLEKETSNNKTQPSVANGNGSVIKRPAPTPGDAPILDKRMKTEPVLLA